MKSKMVAVALVLAGCGEKEADDTGGRDTSLEGDDTSAGGDDTGTGGGEGLLADDFESGLSETSGCSDTMLHAWDGAGEVALTFRAEGALARARAEGPITEAYDMASATAGITLEVEVTDAGQAGINFCTDALSERDVRATYTATSGAVTLNLAAKGDYDGVAALALEGVVFTDADGHTATVESLTISDISVLGVWGG